MGFSIKINDLKRIHYLITMSDVDKFFPDDGSLEYREFVKYLEWYIVEPSVINNYYHAKLLCDAINKFANDKFWTHISIFH